MNMIQKGNIAFSCGQAMQAICQPLFSNTTINYFNYVKILDEQLHISLSTCPEWLKFFLDNKLYKEIAFEKLKLEADSKVILWDLFDESDKIKSAQRNLFNIDHGVTLITQDASGLEYFYFATTPENHQVNNFYINNLPLLSDFIQYFKEKAKNLIHKAHVEPIVRLK